MYDDQTMKRNRQRMMQIYGTEPPDMAPGGPTEPPPFQQTEPNGPVELSGLGGGDQRMGADQMATMQTDLPEGMGADLARELRSVGQGRGLMDRVFVDQEEDGMAGLENPNDENDYFDSKVPPGTKEGDFIVDPRKKRRRL